jgi:pimeloyl-ACP methyl ester carboxylesterase
MLMRRLGYNRYVAQGGDWGAVVTTKLAQQRPPGLAAIHLNFPQVTPDPLPATGLTSEEQHYVDALKRFKTDGFGYFLLQAMRPQTVGYALADSPAGQAGWLYGLFQAWTDNTGDPESALTRDQMPDDITLYWLTNTSASSARMYLENFSDKPNLGRVDLPVGCSIFPHEIFRPPRSWAERLFPHHLLERTRARRPFCGIRGAAAIHAGAARFRARGRSMKVSKRGRSRLGPIGFRPIICK